LRSVTIRIMLFYTLTFLKNPSYWFWCIFFMLFWATLGAFAFTRGITKEWLLEQGVPVEMLDNVWNELVKGYTSSWLASLIVISMGTTASGVVYDFFYSTIPLRYLSKYSRARPEKIIISYLLGTILLMSVNFTILFTIIILMFSYRFETLVSIDNLFGILLASIVYIIVLFLMSINLGLIPIVLRKPRALAFLGNFITVLVFVTTLLHVYAGGEYLHYLPNNAAMMLLFSYASGYEIPYSDSLVSIGGKAGNYKAFPIEYSWIILFTWIAVLLTTSIVMFKKQKGVSVEEIIYG